MPNDAQDTVASIPQRVLRRNNSAPWVCGLAESLEHFLNTRTSCCFSWLKCPSHSLLFSCGLNILNLNVSSSEAFQLSRLPMNSFLPPLFPGDHFVLTNYSTYQIIVQLVSFTSEFLKVSQINEGRVCIIFIFGLLVWVQCEQYVLLSAQQKPKEGGAIYWLQFMGERNRLNEVRRRINS